MMIPAIKGMVDLDVVMGGISIASDENQSLVDLAVVMGDILVS